MSQDPFDVAKRWFEEVWNLRRAETIDELLTAESVCHADEGTLRGVQEFKERQYHPFLAAFPDLRVTVQDTLAQGDQVVLRWEASGTHTGAGLGEPATSRPVRFRGITWVRVRDGKLVEGWQHSNIPEVLRSLASPLPG
jgi:steroid delta-isomerase-like uncharacterized protein